MMPILCLLIDDDIDDQDIFTLAIDKLNLPIKLEVAHHGLEAINRFEEDINFKPNIIFLDINMPTMNGLQCLSAMSKLSNVSDCLVVIYSTSLPHNTLELFKNNGVSEFLEKPTSFTLLVESLASIFASFR